MRRKAKFSKEIKIAACEKYKSGKGSFKSIANEIGCANEVIRRWYYSYIRIGPTIFDDKPTNNSYSSEFKLKLINEVKCSSITAIACKYGLSCAVVRKWYLKYNNGEEIKDYSPCNEVYTMKSRKTTFEERIEIVKYVLENNNDYKGAATTYSVPYASVYQWVKKYLELGEDGLTDQRGRPSINAPKKELTELEKKDLEIEKLKLELARKDRVITVLKKNVKIREEFLKENSQK